MRNVWIILLFAALVACGGCGGGGVAENGGLDICGDSVAKACYQGDVYWYDRCGNRKELYATCSRSTGCTNGACNGGCSSHETRACYEENPYWYDSCGNPEELIEECEENEYCETGLCMPECYVKTLGGSYDDFGHAIKVTSDGGFIIAGASKSYGTGYDLDAILVKTDRLGETEWVKAFNNYDDDAAYSVQQTSGGGYVFAGYSYQDYSYNRDIYIVKTDSAGNTEWTEFYGDSYSDETAYSIVQTSDGGYAVAGYIYDSHYAVFVLKLDSSGVQQWYKPFSCSSYCFLYSIIESSDRGLVVAGYSTISYDDNAWVFKLDSSGNTVWSRLISSYYDNYTLRSVQQTADGGYITVGGADNYPLIIKFNSSGETEWSNIFSGTSYYSYRNKGLQTSDGGYIIGGYSYYYDDLYLIKTDQYGSLEWSDTIDNNGDDIFYDIALLSNGYVLVGYNAASNYDDILIVKTNADCDCDF